MKKSLLFGVLCAALIVVPACGNRYTTTESGIKYEVEKQGAGEKARRGDTVKVHYTGWLDEQGKQGTKFDSSVDRGQPFSVPAGVGMVIAGWDEMLLDMKKGEKRYVIIPPQLGYGKQAMGKKIPANSTLRFSMELLDIIPAQQPKKEPKKEAEGPAT